MKHNDGIDHHDHERIVELTTVPTRIEADALIAELKGKRIDATISTDDVGGMRPHLAYVDGVRVLVFENDLAAAQQVMRDFFG